MKNETPQAPLYVLLSLLCAVLLIGGGVLLIAKTNPSARAALLANPLVEHFKHTYNSVKKLPDILFIPYLFAKGSIPTYRLTIPLDNIIRMNAALPPDPFLGKLEEENKEYVRGEFTDPERGYSIPVHLKYRGISPNHWNALQKSYRVQFPDGNFWQGQRLVTFVTPYDRNYYVEPLNMYRAKKFGLMYLDMQFARLNINGQDAGVYLAFEHWSPELLAKKGLPETKLFGMQSDPVASGSLLSRYENIADELDIKKEELAALFALRDHADDRLFAKLLPQLVDMDKLYAWNILTILSGSTHQTEEANGILFFDTSRGKFEIVPWDTEIADVVNHPYDDTTSKLMTRVLSIPEFRAERDRRLTAYLDDPKNLEDDLAFYDRLAKETRTDFLKDVSKFHNDLQFLSIVARDRTWITNAFAAARLMLDPSYVYPRYVPEGELAFSGSFRNFGDLALTIDGFLAGHPQFYRIDDATVGLSGAATFFSDVTIPSGISLRIAPNSTLLFDTGVSLFVRGRVEARGTADAPIRISGLNPERPWGTFTVIDAEGESVLSFVLVSGGSGTVTNGIIVTGMLAFHGSNVAISYSSFADSGDDDQVNVKNALARINYSNFRRSFSDALDLDFLSPGSEVFHNTFSSIGVDGNGDAIDLSFSDVHIADNEIRGCNDKGISVGERSRPIIELNTIEGCAIGVAVKDRADALISQNVFTNNAVAVSLYRKKDTFGGSHALLEDNTIRGGESVATDAFSSVDYSL